MSCHVLVPHFLSCKVDMPNFNITIIWHLYLNGMRFGLDFRFGIKNSCVQWRLDYMLKMCYHSRFNSQHDLGGGDLYDHLLNSRIFTLIMNKRFIWTTRQTATCTISICQLSQTNCVFWILQEVSIGESFLKDNTNMCSRVDLVNRLTLCPCKLTWVKIILQ